MTSAQGPMRLIIRWAEARMTIARMTLTIKLDGNWSSFQLANSAPPLSVTDSAIAPFRKDRLSHSSGALWLPGRRAAVGLTASCRGSSLVAQSIEQI